MRVLFVSQYFPVDEETLSVGVYQRMGMFLEALGAMAELDILYFVPAGYDRSTESVARAERLIADRWGIAATVSFCPHFQPSAQMGALRRIGFRARSLSAGAVSALGAPSLMTSGPEQVSAVERGLARSPDAVFAHRLGAMAPLLLIRRPLPPVFFDLDDVEHLAHRRAGARLPRRRIEEGALWWAERRALSLARLTFVCSESDRDRLPGSGRGVAVVANAVDDRPDPEPLPAAERMLFLATYAHEPNRTAVRYLLDEIWPRVREELPRAELLIAGPHPEAIAEHTSPPPGVSFPGFVRDLAGLYASVRVVCCPILSGGGTRIKILEASAYGRPVVSTTVGAEGLGLRDGHEILVRDRPETFAAACVRLLRSEADSVELADHARRAVRRRFDRGATLARIRETIAGSLASSA